MTSRKYKSLTIAEKLKVILAVEAGEKKKNVAEQYGIPSSTLSTILKNKDSIKANKGHNAKKRNRQAEYPKLEECLVKWFSQCRQKNIPVGGVMLKEKAKSFAISLGIQNFSGSEGWLEKFKKRHNLVFRKICGESASVDTNICENWKNELSVLLEGYEACNVFNADETGLFYKCLPDRTMSFKNEKCHGGKHSKERVTILFAANMDGSQKLKPLLIGKSAKPRCFKGIKSFPMTYRFNRKAWMTTNLFQEWLLDLDNQMKKQKRKVLLFIDNCSSHNALPELDNVHVKFLPPNTTSKLQPLDQGIINNFKVFYRKEIVTQMLDCLEEGNSFNITVLTAMRIADKAWKNVSQTTIRNCFRSCGFDNKTGDQLLQLEEGDADLPEEWDALTHQQEIPVTFNEFVNFDDNVATTGTLTDAEILESTTDNSDIEDNEEEEPTQSISAKEARKMVKSMRYFLERREIGDDVFTALVTIENALDQSRRESLMQKKITDYF